MTKLIQLFSPFQPKNVGQFDQILRVGIGFGLIYAGFFKPELIGAPLLAVMIGCFGAMNTFAAINGRCPMYRLAGISTYASNQDANTGSSRGLRARFLAATLALAVLVLVIYGAVAFRVADEVSQLQSSAAIDKAARHLATTLANGHHTDVGQALEDAGELFDLIVLEDPQGQALHTYPQTLATAQLLAVLPDTRPLGTSDAILNGEQYFRTVLPVPGSKLQMVTLSHAGGSSQTVESLIALKLGVAGFIVVWIAVWVAMLIASTMGRKLDEHNARILHQAHYDDLTGLPNRVLLRDRIEQALRIAARERKPVALLVMDLDRFKDVNDTLGHPSGDELLKVIAGRLHTTLRESDICARLGGDEFAIVLPNTSVDGARACAKKVNEVLDSAIMVGGVALQTKTSIGIAVFPDHGNTIDSLISHADIAMYKAKFNFSGFEVFVPEDGIDARQRLTLSSDLRQAVEMAELQLAYQPKLDLRTCTFTGVEALARWTHPRLGNIRPDKFIVLAEQHGLIQGLTDWVMREAISTCAKWQREGLDMTVAINLSPLILIDKELPLRIQRILDETGAPPEKIELELTETAAMSDVARATEIFSVLSSMGMRISIDDFGTGMSSLSYLKRLPVQDIKIDRSFITDMLRDEHSAVLVHSIIDLAHNLDRQVIAEGIEDLETLKALQQLGCDAAQGYFICKPASRVEVEKVLRAGAASLISNADCASSPVRASA